MEIPVAVIVSQWYISHMSLEWATCSSVERNPERVSGSWVFQGTRVPVRALFENLEDGATVDDFLEWFPGVTRSQVEAVLVKAAESLTAETAQ